MKAAQQSCPVNVFFMSAFVHGFGMKNASHFSLKTVFPSSGGGNHLDQSALWHRDVIKLLMSLNRITCDPVAGELPQRCHSIVSKTPLGGRNGKHLQLSTEGKKEEENTRMDGG